MMRTAHWRRGIRKNIVLWLIVALPVVSIVMGAVTFALALQSSDEVTATGSHTLSKTSWRTR